MDPDNVEYYKICENQLPNTVVMSVSDENILDLLNLLRIPLHFLPSLLVCALKPDLEINVSGGQKQRVSMAVYFTHSLAAADDAHRPAARSVSVEVGLRDLPVSAGQPGEHVERVAVLVGLCPG